MRAHKGFTLLEAVVTLSILAISFALTIGVVAALTNLQSTAQEEENINYQLKKADDTVNEFVNFISIEGFEYNSVESDQSNIVFTYSTYNFKLSFFNHTLSIDNNYSGDNDYFKKTKDVHLENVDDIDFSFESSIALLCADVKYGSNSLRYSYVVRTLMP